MEKVTVPEVSLDAHKSVPLLSIIITTYTLQRLKDVQELLDSLKAQTYPNLEIIFVGERAPELCEKVTVYAEERGFDNLKILFNNGASGLSHARNLGVQHANGEIIAFTDDHAVAPPEWAENVEKTFAKYPSIIGLTGPSLPLWEHEKTSWFPEEFYWMLSCRVVPETSEAYEVRNPWGVNMAFRKEAFQFCQFSELFGVSNQGMPEGVKLGLVCDDSDFGVRISQQSRRPIMFSPGVKILNKVHSHKLASYFLRRRAFWEGYTKAVLRKLYGRTGVEKFPLSSERGLIKVLALNFFPKTLIQLFIHPKIASRRLLLALSTLFHASLGYLCALFPWPATLITRRYSR